MTLAAMQQPADQMMYALAGKEEDMSEVDLLHAKAFVRSLPAEQRKILEDPDALEINLAMHDIDTKKLSADEMQALWAEIGDGNGSSPKVTPSEQSTSSSHDNVQQRIQEVLDTDPRIRDWAIDALVAGSIVTLTGVVSSRQQKGIVEQVVHEVPGVTAVVNDIEIE
jgi:hypothetical protein